MSWSEWQWQSVVRGRRSKRKSLPQSQHAFEEDEQDDIELPVEKTESGPGRPEQAAERVQLDGCWLRRTREFFKNPPQWKIKVENTFISIHGWHDRTLRTTLSAPACLITASGRIAGGSPQTPPDKISSPDQQHCDKAKGNPAEVGAGLGRLPANFPSAPTSKPPAPPAMAEEAEDSPSSSTIAVRAADEAAGPKKRKPKNKVRTNTASTETTPMSQMSTVATPPVAQPRPAPEMKDFGMITVVRGRRRRGHRMHILTQLDADTGTSAEADDEDTSSLGQTSYTPCHTKDADDIFNGLANKWSATKDGESHGLSASPSIEDLHEPEEVKLCDEDDAKDDVEDALGQETFTEDIANDVVEAVMRHDSNPLTSPVSSPSGKAAKRQRKKAARAEKAAAKANLAAATEKVATHERRIAVASQLGSGQDLCSDLRGITRCSWPCSRPRAGRAREGALQLRPASFPSVEERRASASDGSDESEVLFFESEDDREDLANLEKLQNRLSEVKAKYAKAQREAKADELRDGNAGARMLHVYEEAVRQAELAVRREEMASQKENGAALSPANAATAAQAFFVDRGGSFPTCGMVAAGDAAAGNGVCIDHLGKASLSTDCGDIERVIAALVREKGLAGMPGRSTGLSAN